MRQSISRASTGHNPLGIAARALIALVLALAVLVSPVSGATKAHAKVTETGANFWYQVQSGVAQREAYCAPSSDESLRRLVETGATNVDLIVVLAQDTKTSSSVHRRYNTPTDPCLIHAIQQAHKDGLKVAIKMGLTLNATVPGESSWSARFQPKDPDAWQASWDTWLDHYGRMAQQYGVETLVIGTEQGGQILAKGTLLKKYDKHNPARWIKSVKKVRKIYKGEVTYAAHDQGDAKFLDPKLVKLFDHFGLTFYPTINRDKSSVSELKKQLKPYKKSLLDKLGKRFKKKIVVYEFGTQSSSHDKVNLQYQANFYEAMLSLLYSDKYVKGAHTWGWYTNPNEGGSSSMTLTPQNKPAETVMTKWFGGKSINVWWPQENAKVSGTVASVRAKQSDNQSLSKYAMTYQVDGGKRIKMGNLSGIAAKGATINPSKLSKGKHVIVIRSVDTKGKPNGAAVRNFTVV